MDSLLSKRKLSINNKTKKDKKTVNKKDKRLLGMCMPTMIFLLLFNYIPMFGLILAFKDFRYDKGIFGSEWVGFANFEFFLKSDNAWRITRNTIGFNLLFIVLGLIVAVVFALIINEVKSKNGRKFYQTTMFLPYFLSWVVVGYMLYAFLNQNYGIVNNVLVGLGMEPVKWYMDANKWIVLLPLIFIWKSVGYSSVIYYAGLLSIDSAYYESAALDGATRGQMMRYISLPHIVPLMIIMTILNIGKIFNSDFGLFFQATMDSSALYPVTDVLDTYVYRALKVTGDVGMSSAVGFYQSVVGFCVVVLANGIIRKIDKENAMF